MRLQKSKQILNSTKSQTMQDLDIQTILRQSIFKIKNKYCTSQNYYLTTNINKAIQNKPCKLKTFLIDQTSNKSEEYLQNYNKLSVCIKEMQQLTQYYRYYTQSSILYQPKFFKLMYHQRQKRKMIQYNKLKILLNLSDSSQQNTEQKHQTPASSFNLLQKLSFTYKKIDQQSMLIANIVKRMQRQYGPTRHKTIQQVDNSFILYKKPQNLLFTESGSVVYSKMKGFKKEQLKISKIMKYKKQRNNSNLINLQKQFKFDQSKQKNLKKKHQSMDNLQTVNNIYGKQNKNLCKIINAKTMKRKRLSQQKLGSQNIKQKILNIKQKIKQEKIILKKKITTSNQSSELLKHIRKITTIQSPKQKLKNKKQYYF